MKGKINKRQLNFQKKKIYQKILSISLQKQRKELGAKTKWESMKNEFYNFYISKLNLQTNNTIKKLL